MIASVAFSAKTMVAFVLELWFNPRMFKSEAINLLGSDAATAAGVLEVSYQAVNKWPELLPRRISDRVLGACLRNGIAVPGKFLQPNTTQAPASRAVAATETVAQGVA